MKSTNFSKNWGRVAALLLAVAIVPLLAARQPGKSGPIESKNQAALSDSRTQILIDQVERAYANGLAAYHKGQLSEAKAEFDRAVDLMLASDKDIKSDARLQAEFDHIIDNVNALEMEALKQGNGFTPNVEPTPSDVANDVTFEPDPKLVAKTRAALTTTKSDLPLVVNDYVAGFINFFANSQRGHNTLLHSFQRAGRYRAMIQRVMAEEGVPQDLIYLAVAESGFQPQAVNRKSGAGGMWQFMPHGDYGLARTNYVDERFDPEKSTRAYARYMKFLYAQLGDWYLSMAAYDWGAGNVQRAVQKTGYADFWELYKRNNLPGETKNYVPEILAAIVIAKNPRQYGFDDVTLDPPVLDDTLTISYAVDLRLVADIIKAPVELLTGLNPSLLHTSTPTDAVFDLHLPAGTATVFEQRIEAVPEEKRTTWRYRHIGVSDTLASVAHDFHLSTSDLAAANHLESGDSLEGLDALVIPVVPTRATQTRAQLYTVHSGDTLVTIADRFNVSLVQLRRWNGLSGIKVAPGKRLHIAEPTESSRKSGKHKSQSSHSQPTTQENQSERSVSTAHAKGSSRSKASRTGSADKQSRSARPDQKSSTASPSHSKNNHSKSTPTKKFSR